jgi:glyoxylase-like metal-dependent hydrolase (beta-lactamase superfamily II)
VTDGSGIHLRRLSMGDFLAPPPLPMAGQRIVVTAWVARTPDAVVLIDTGIAPGLPDEDEALYRFHRRPIEDALAEAGLAPGDVDVVLNCHLHADHAGGNRTFRGTPILVRAAELEVAREPDYSVPSALDLDEGSYRVIDGVHEVVPGIRSLHTPGHTPGHQAVVIDTPEGPMVLAGQGYRQVSEYAMALRAIELEDAGETDHPPYEPWVREIRDLDPFRVLFAHDLAIWQRGT